MIVDSAWRQPANVDRSRNSEQGKGPPVPDGEHVTLLLVEDDARIRQSLGLALTDEGFAVRSAPTGEEALTQLSRRAHGIDLVLLDVMLPGLDGVEVCRRVRANGPLPIIMVTARADSSDLVAGLEAGADDYVTKPVVAAELTARIRALLRRSGSEPSTRETVLTVGDLAVDLDRGEVTRAGQAIHLTRTEFRLLVELVSAAGKVVTREDLLRRVWDYDYFGDTRLLDVHVRRLRRKVEHDPDHPAVVLTVRGSGYRIAG